MAADGLTPRQRDVLDLLSDGYTNKAIAARLYLAEGTVSNVVARIYDAMGIEDTPGQNARVTAVRRYLDDTKRE